MADNTLERNLVHRVNVGDALTRTAARHPDHLAIIDGERRWTYREFDTWVNHVANALIARGYRRGDALALLSGNSLEFLATYYACAKSGVVCVPLNLGWRDVENEYVLRHSKARGIVVESQLLEKAEAALNPDVKDVFVARGIGGAARSYPGKPYEIFESLTGVSARAPDVLIEDRDPLSYLYTSGTTASPKGVIGSHLAVHLESLTVAIDLSLTKGDRMLCLMPMFHTAQLNAFCTPAVTVGTTMVLMRGFDADRVLELIETESLSVLFALPMMYRALVEKQKAAKRNVTSLRLAVYAMTPMPDHELKAAIETFDCGFSLMFGQTEMSPVATFFRPEHQLSHIGAVGTASVNVEVGIMAPDGRLLPRGEVGEIVYRGPHTTEGYLEDEAATDSAFRHGWFHSGDTGRLAEDGMLWFEDRSKDVIKSGGENVASIEVEKLVYEVAPEIQAAAVIGLPHAHWIEAITVIAVKKAGHEIDAVTVITRLKERLSSFKVPKAIIFVEALPMTSTGKVQKNVLRESHRGHYDGAGK